MKPLASTMTEFDTLPDDLGSAEFGIGDPRWAMRSLADLYSNRELAVIREYSTNGYDAQIMAGMQDEPIEVTLPSNTDPFFRVKDKGVGMTREMLLKRYTQFGISDKRERNDVNGMLGFGCKAAIAYTTQFTVTSVCDGYKTSAVVSRRPDWSVVMKVVAYSATTEPNGTEIEIPVSDIPKFNHMAGDFYKFWHTGSVSVNGVYPEQAVGEKIDDNLFYSKAHGTSYVVMGNVAYRINNPDFLFRQKRINPISFVAYVDHLSDDDGPAIEHTPSREDLKYEARTNATLNKVIGGFIDKMLEKAKAELSKATDYFSAYSIYMEWGSRLGGGVMDDLEFKGSKFEDRFALNGVRYTFGESRGYGTRRIDSWSVNDMRNSIIITGFDMELTSSHKAKARQWSQMDGNPHASRYIFTAETKVPSKWIDPKRVVDWETLKTAIPKKQRDPNSYYGGTRRVKGTFDYWTSKGLAIEKPLPDSGDLFYVTVSDSKALDPQKALSLLGWDDAAVIKLAVNRVEKFKRDNPQVKEFVSEATKRVVIKGETLLDADEKFIIGLSYKTRQWLNVLDVASIDDPDWKRAKALYNKPGLNKKYDDNIALAMALNMRYDVKTHNIGNNDNSLVSRYPIMEYLATHNRTVMADVVLYMNAAYNKAKKGN